MGRGGRGNQTGGASRNKVSQVAETSTREEAKEKRDDVNVLDDVERHSIAAAQTNSDALEKSHAELEAENKKLGDYYMKINDMYWNDEIFEVNHGEGFYTDKFVEMVVDL